MKYLIKVYEFQNGVEGKEIFPSVIFQKFRDCSLEESFLYFCKRLFLESNGLTKFKQKTNIIEQMAAKIKTGQKIERNK